MPTFKNDRKGEEMKLEFLGTGAADYRLDKRVEGELFRRWSCMLINDDLLIDPGPHVADYLEKNNCPQLLDNVKYPNPTSLRIFSS